MDRVPEYGVNLTPPVPDRSAWSPMALAVIAVVLNFWPASVFHALNYERLGAPELKTPRLVQYSLLGVIMCMFVVSAQLSQSVRPMGYLPLVANVVFGWRFYRSQQPLYERHLASGGARASLVAPLLVSLAFVVCLAGLSFGVDLLVAR